MFCAFYLSSVSPTLVFQTLSLMEKVKIMLSWVHRVPGNRVKAKMVSTNPTLYHGRVYSGYHSSLRQRHYQVSHREKEGNEVADPCVLINQHLERILCGELIKFSRSGFRSDKSHWKEWSRKVKWSMRRRFIYLFRERQSGWVEVCCRIFPKSMTFKVFNSFSVTKKVNPAEAVRRRWQSLGKQVQRTRFTPQVSNHALKFTQNFCCQQEAGGSPVN